MEEGNALDALPIDGGGLATQIRDDERPYTRSEDRFLLTTCYLLKDTDGHALSAAMRSTDRFLFDRRILGASHNDLAARCVALKSKCEGVRASRERQAQKALEETSRAAGARRRSRVKGFGAETETSEAGGVASYRRVEEIGKGDSRPVFSKRAAAVVAGQTSSITPEALRLLRGRHLASLAQGSCLNATTWSRPSRRRGPCWRQTGRRGRCSEGRVAPRALVFLGRAPSLILTCVPYVLAATMRRSDAIFLQQAQCREKRGTPAAQGGP